MCDANRFSHSITFQKNKPHIYTLYIYIHIYQHFKIQHDYFLYILRCCEILYHHEQISFHTIINSVGLKHGYLNNAGDVTHYSVRWDKLHVGSDLMQLWDWLDWLDLHSLRFTAVTTTPKIMATTVKPWAKIRALIDSWDCLVFPWWKERRPYIRAPAVPKQPGEHRAQTVFRPTKYPASLLGTPVH